MKNVYFNKFFQLGLVFFALAGFILLAGFFSVKLGLTKAGGKVDLNDRYFQTQTVSTAMENSGDRLCAIIALGAVSPETGRNLLSYYLDGGNANTVDAIIRANEIYLINNEDYGARREDCRSGKFSTADYSAWQRSEEWLTLKAAVVKDKEVIDRVAKETGVSSRMIVSMLVGEQMRLFNSYREIFKQIFQPLKILGNETKFSLGVTGVKEDTARMVEKNLLNAQSEFYLGPQYANLVTFTTDNIDEERFLNLTNDDDHYYSYLYAALFLKQVEKQWQSAGFDISGRPEILATIYNLGFSKSIPKANPQVGGSVFKINGFEYTFGSIAHLFYYSGELLNEFPIE